MYPLKTRDAGKLRWQYKVRNVPNKRLAAKADRAVWEKVTKGRAGMGWDSVFKQVWKDMGANEEEIISTEKFRGYKAEVRENTAISEKLL